MINNYFLLYHSTNYVLVDDTLLLNFKDNDFDKIAALILTIKDEKLVAYLELEEFKKLYKKIIINGFLDASSLYEFCFIILQRISKQPDLAFVYIDVFNYLYSKNLITKQEKLKLITIFEPLTLQIRHTDKNNNSFILNKEIILETLPKTEILFESDALIDDLNNLKSYIQNQIFSIGVTGVMNVGKSTFINSLLSTELLGSSVVAETANLSVIRYSKKVYTKVSFFNKSEFDEMLHTFSDDLEQKTYLSKLESSVNINDYVKESTYTIDINRNELHKYTSASDSSGLCHIVKNVGLGVNLDFLSDSIEIVDTPGLDDSLIVRESVTQKYISNCDLLIHLMNVNQSATQKDVDFIIDAVLNQNVRSILILLTKADNVTKKELDEVIEYTKNSIENQLASLKSDSNIVNVMSSLKFLSISAKTALDIRKQNQEDTKKDLLKQSGILEVEDYLFKTLFSKSSKNEQIIQTSSRRLKDIIKSQIKVYHYNLVLYSKDENALEDELKNFNKIKEQNSLIYKKIDTDINIEYDSFRVYLESLNLDMDKEISELKERVLDRVTNEITYTLKKDKFELKEIQLKMIIDKSLNHGFIDIVRDHKYKLEQKVQNISKNIELSFKSYNIQVDEIQDRFSMQTLFEKNSNSVLTTGSKMILKQVLKLTKGLKLSGVASFKENFSTVLDEEFIYVKTHLETTLMELNESILTTLFDALRLPIKRLEEELSEYEDSLEKQIFLLKDKDKNIEQIQIDTQGKINSLEVIMESI